MEFRDYLKMKLIDPGAFQKGDSSRYEQWERDFRELGAVSFTSRYLFHLNPTRRRYRLAIPVPTEKVDTASAKPAKPAAPAQPKIKPKFT